MANAHGWRATGIAVALALAAGLAGCVDDGITSLDQAASNLPSVGVTAQGVGFAVLADHFTFEQTYASPTEGDSLNVGLAVTGYGGGSALVEITDADGATPYALLATSSLAQGQTTVRGRPPYRVHVRFTGFSGVFALGVAASGP